MAKFSSNGPINANKEMNAQKAFVLTFYSLAARL